MSVRLHSAERLAAVIVSSLRSEVDPRTVNLWGQVAATSAGALRMWCVAAGVKPKSVLDFVRLYRAVVLSAETGCRVRDFLDVVDRRTLNALLRRGGLIESENHTDSESFLKRQQLITCSVLLPAIRNALTRERTGSTSP